ncbi:MAG: hypothetical protein ACLROH_07825 [Streptococcus sp.]
MDQAYFGYLFAEAKSKRQSYYQSELDTAFKILIKKATVGKLTIDLYGDYAVFIYNALFVKSESFFLALFQRILEDENPFKVQL